MHRGTKPLEPGGLDPEFMVALIRRLGREFGLCAGELVELAPPLAGMLGEVVA